MISDYFQLAATPGVCAIVLGRALSIAIYRLVSYRWPTWLRPQFETQRIIWGNKILFLDVIFPLGLDRVIYIDVD
jgi:hypothetical protein